VERFCEDDATQRAIANDLSTDHCTSDTNAALMIILVTLVVKRRKELQRVASAAPATPPATTAMTR
jgi:hypothetical protein